MNSPENNLSNILNNILNNVSNNIEQYYNNIVDSIKKYSYNPGTMMNKILQTITILHYFDKCFKQYRTILQHHCG